jgi:hypothetical protein
MVHCVMLRFCNVLFCGFKYESCDRCWWRMLHVWRLGTQGRMQHRLRSNRTIFCPVGTHFGSVQQTTRRSYVQAVICRDSSHRWYSAYTFCDVDSGSKCADTETDLEQLHPSVCTLWLCVCVYVIQHSIQHIM